LLLVLIMSIVIHELAHGYSALWQGDPTAKYAGRLTFNPIKHLDLLGSFIVPTVLLVLNVGFILGWAKPVPINPYNFKDQRWGEALVAAAGPAVNILIAVLAGLLLRLFLSGSLIEPSDPLTAILGLIVVVNLILAIFNLIPIPPLDGSKILFAFLPSEMLRFRLLLEQNGLLVVLLFLFLLGWLIFPLIGLALTVTFDLIVGDSTLVGLVFDRFFDF